MDGSRFDDLARSLAGRKSRRGFVGGLLALGAGLAVITPAGAACPPGQMSLRGQCACKQTGRPPVGGACPCPAGQFDTGDGQGCLACRADADCDDGNPCTANVCGGGACRKAAAVCPAAVAPCRVAVCQPKAGGCVEVPVADGTACDNGDACTRTDTCRAGVCEGGNLIVCAAADPCHLAGICDPATGRCSAPPAPAGTPCGSPATCAGGVQHAQDACDGGGICGAGATQTCDPYLCGSSTCLTSCAQDADCAGAAHCDGGACVGDRAEGEACDEPSDCQSGVCNAASGVCCAETCPAGVACGGPGFTCDEPSCGAATQSCCAGGSCDAGLACIAGTCQTPPACHASGEPCPNRNQDCCAGLICSSGQCQPLSTCQGAGQPCPGGNQDCCADLTCVNGSCATPPSCITSGLRCDLGPCCSDLCIDTRCTDNLSCQQFGQACDTDHPCCSAFFCSAGTCLVRPPCRAAGEACPNGVGDCCNGLTCTGGLCASICQGEEEACPNGDQDCCADLTCSAAGWCQAQCAPPGQHCHFRDCCVGGLCIDGRCMGTEEGCKRGGEPCGGSNGECCVSDGGIPLACVEGICGRGCFPDGVECFFGDICCSGVCVGEFGMKGQCG